MKNRKEVITKLINQVSILEGTADSYDDLLEIHKSEKLWTEISNKLEKIGTEPAKSRATFIREQTVDNFDLNREEWGIPNFAEDLVRYEDFENGFLWRFRAHTTSWSENQYADQWFYTSLEARSVRRYEFWDCDEGPDKMDLCFEGDYKAILQQLLAARIYEVLISPVFSTEELTEYIAKFSEDEEDYMLEDIIEDYISRNPNYKPS
ncbi:hypothetical protein QMK33_21475 [Hymenobacter sp. H14-R3]|uniref:hypothetical protein n=1 Tax=Hymenobacter sp. H14-R3 TaxID=3046308 RepID=UPI0024BAF108|nr:hypothetical protein [Hymenobacter sp. H14-R3]MDJ0367725.1 hypothetical protein [Hymenobacter sp. H14-R3]